MPTRVLTDKEYVKLAAKLDTVAPDAASQLKQAHRLLCEGRKLEDMTPSEQFYAAAFEGATCVQIPNNYGWEPGVEVAEAAPEPDPESKPKKQKRSE